MSRPTYLRASSTNLSAGAAARPLEGKLAIVTGGSRGIGAATARNLASKGASLVLGYNSDSSTERTASLASSLEAAHGIRALPVQADMGDPHGPAHLIAVAKNHFAHPKSGKLQVDIVVNNAGAAQNQTLADITAESFARLYAVNVQGPLLLLQAALPHLPYDRSGRIVNISSTSASAGMKGQSAYGGSKAALEAMTRTWSRELAERATVNAVNPGPVDTDMYGSVTDRFAAEMRPFIQTAPLMQVRDGGVDSEQAVRDAEKVGGRLGYDHEVAGVVAMLCTADAAWCTGSVVCANGGMRFSM